MTIRNLVLVLGDQLNADSAVFDDFDRDRDAVWMAEVMNESKVVWSHKVRIVLFLSAMRHFRDRLRQRGIKTLYTEIDGEQPRETFAASLAHAVERQRPKRIIVAQPGEWRVLDELTEASKKLGVEIDVLPDRHFFSSPQEFADHAQGRKQIRLEYFYREMRRKHNVLMDGDQPIGGQWNFDKSNRGSFGKQGPTDLPETKTFDPDDTTAEVIQLVDEIFPDHPGDTARFDWPVTPQDAQLALEEFIRHGLADFGQYQDAMWTGEPYLYHSRLAAALNLKLLDPRDVVAAAEAAFRDDQAPLNSVEGFVRQILGWREYVRGVYWLYMPEYLERNTFNADRALPDFFWSGETEMKCLAEAIGQTLELGYAHHIQRLMVTGLFCLLLGVDPREVHRWYLAVYADAVEWVELPNSLGMSQFADGGEMASKPYVATGKYIQRMSNYCHDCRYDPAQSIGANACPFTTLYWDFLRTHRQLLSANPRMALQLRNLDRKTDDELARIKEQASSFRDRLGC